MADAPRHEPVPFGFHGCRLGLQLARDPPLDDVTGVVSGPSGTTMISTIRGQALSLEGPDQMEALQHVLAIVGALIAVVASFRQGRTAKERSARHKRLYLSEKDSILKADLKLEAEHSSKGSAYGGTPFSSARFSAAAAEVLNCILTRSLQ